MRALGIELVVPEIEGGCSGCGIVAGNVRGAHYPKKHVSKKAMDSPEGVIRKVLA